jgi:predicted helicase
MASYAMCHMKLDMILTELGYQPTGAPPRLGVYLTNSLEQGDRDVRDLFMAKWLSDEARCASTIKRQTPIMCVVGNPPYLGEGGASTGWMGTLMEDYKKEPGGAEKLRERNPKWINDLYVKFLRLSSHLIEKNGEGVLGFITNHGYLDNPTFRGMRWHLLNTFDKIWVLDLHGNAKKKEVAPDGGADKNVFDIMQGVSIIIAAKKKGKGPKPLAQVMQGDLWGARAAKYAALQTGTLAGGLFTRLETPAPQYPLVRRNFNAQAVYEQGFAINAFMPANSVGIVTARDSLTIDMDKETLWARVRDFANLPPEEARSKYDLGKDVQDWAVARAQKDVQDHLDHARIVPIAYRPFDTRQTFYTGTSRGFICRPRDEVMRHLANDENLNLIIGRQGQVVGSMEWNVGFCARGVLDFNMFYRGGGMCFPLYLYPSEQDLDQSRRVNFDPALFKALQNKAADPARGTPDEVAVFDYIYGVLHCPAYRQTYAEFLKIDFPRIPWPATSAAFWDISAKGAQLRALHLMQPAAIGDTPYPFDGDGDSVVEKPRFEGGRVWINDTQSFANAPAVAWEFYIGGYQPAQKWLKDRRGRALAYDDIRHYQSILKILSETARIMETIEMAL